MKRMTTTLFALLLGGAAAGAGEPAGKAVKVPFDLLKTRHMTVNVKINGQGPFRLIFDTGAPFTFISQKAAKAAGVIGPKAKGVGPFTPYKVKTLEIGPLKAANMPVRVMEHFLLTEMSKHVGPIDGIVGFTFFARYRLTIDYQTKEMTFVPNDFRPPDVVDKMFAAVLTKKSDKEERKVVGPAGVWGFRVQEKDKDDAEPGVTVKDVVPGSPAEKAGLRAGDRLLTLDDRWTDSVVDCYRAASHVRPGTAARLVVKRDGKQHELTVTVQAGL
jgi:hypothetical protein